MDSTSDDPTVREQIRLQPLDMGEMVPGGYWRRLGAGIIDGVLMALITVPAQVMLVFLSAVSIQAGGSSPIGTLLYYGVSLIASYFYYGWFYSNKGATPGKLVLDLKVVDSEAGTYLSYPRAFLRETFGKFITSLSLIFLIGFLIFLRSDKRMLHDLIFNTRVIWKKS